MRTLTVDGFTREYLIHIPNGYIPGRPSPLILEVHGDNIGPELEMFFFALYAQADLDKGNWDGKNGNPPIVVYGQGLPCVDSQTERCFSAGLAGRFRQMPRGTRSAKQF